MAEYAVNFMGNICELFIILFFLKGNYNPRVKKTVFIPLCIVFVIFQFLNTNLFLAKSCLIILGGSLFCFLVSLLYEMKWSNRFLYSIFLYLILALPEAIISMTLSLIFDVDVSYLQNNAVIFAACTVTSRFLSYIFVLITKKSRFKLDSELQNKMFFGIYSLPLASVLVMVLFLKCCYVIEEFSFQIITLVTSIILVFANIAIFYIIDKQNELIETKEKLFFTETHINSQIAHYEELYKHQTELRSFRHDIKNTFLSLIGILKEGDTEKALHAMQSNLDMLDEMNKSIVNTGHPITDAILKSKLHDADINGIKLNISTKLTEKIVVDELELGIVLGNALDNAIEAAAKVDMPDKFVSFEMITTAERIIITIENSVDGNVDPDKLITSKKDKLNHGHGVGSIKTITKKYDGVVKFTCEDKIFSVNINISNSRK